MRTPFTSFWSVHCLLHFLVSHIPRFIAHPKRGSIGSILYSFKHPTPDILNLKVKYVGNAQLDAFGSKILKASHSNVRRSEVDLYFISNCDCGDVRDYLYLDMNIQDINIEKETM